MNQQAIEDGVSIIIPANNEAGGIGLTLEKIIDVMGTSGRAHEIILVDDGSDDDTADLGAGYSDHVRIIRHDVNRGYGAALKTGLRQAKFATICITDADGTYPNEMIPALTEKVIAGECDMAVGARIGDSVAVPWIRRPAKWVIGHLANYVAGRNIPDINSGLRAFRRDLARRMFFVLPDGFSFTSTITLTMITNDFEVEYVPINYHKRIGRSKIGYCGGHDQNIMGRPLLGEEMGKIIGGLEPSDSHVRIVDVRELTDRSKQKCGLEFQSVCGLHKTQSQRSG